MANEDRIEFNFSYAALKLLGSGLYSNPWSALSELVANGFDAGAHNVYVLFDWSGGKERSSIEVLDDGRGMSIEDLRTKYAIVGRDKRKDGENNSSVMGRKGIGKLSTLYLCDTFDIITKAADGTTAWNMDVRAIADTEVPGLSRIAPDEVAVVSEELWAKQSHGTLLKLFDVDLSKVGERRFQSIMARFADYYLLDDNRRHIYVALRESSNDPVLFQRVQKTIAYRNFCALFNNSAVSFPGFDSQRVFVPSSIIEILEGYPAIPIASSDFVTEGKLDVEDAQGRRVSKDYRLVGWIGIHTSISVPEAQKNDERFYKNSIVSPNRLRLYTRGKLAINNFLDYIKNTQAFSNYIEGEISFDVLDDDDLPDIATANRQQIAEKDPRLQKLIELVKPIVTKLIQCRIKLAETVKKDELAVLEKREQAAEQKHKAEVQKLNQHIARTTAELSGREAQVRLLSKGMPRDVSRLFEAIHTIRKNCSLIRRKVQKCIREMPDNPGSRASQRRVSEIGLINEESFLMTVYANKGSFRLQSKSLTANLADFIVQYFETTVSSGTNLVVTVDPPRKDECLFSFDVTAVGIILGNIYSNSEKAGATRLDISVSIVGTEATITFTDNGHGYDHRAFPNPSVFFELGYHVGEQSGDGIGLYHVRELAKKKNGSAIIDSDYSNGFRITVKLHSEDDLDEN